MLLPDNRLQACRAKRSAPTVDRGWSAPHQLQPDRCHLPPTRPLSSPTSTTIVVCQLIVRAGWSQQVMIPSKMLVRLVFKISTWLFDPSQEVPSKTLPRRAVVEQHLMHEHCALAAITCHSWHSTDFLCLPFFLPLILQASAVTFRHHLASATKG